MGKKIYNILFLTAFLVCTFNSYSQVKSTQQVQSQAIADPGNCTNPVRWYFDSDGDDFGNPNISQIACTKPLNGNWALNGDDCNDDEVEITAIVWYVDADKDGYGSIYNSIRSCTQPLNYVNNNADCDDSNKDINPNIKWYLNVDVNGDGVISDLDGAPVMSCTKPAGNYIGLTDKNNHWIHQASYDLKGNAIGSSRVFFDDLGKSDVSLSKDFVTNKIWGTETSYDNFGRPDKTSFVAPSPLSTFDKTNFFKTSGEIAAGSYPATLPLTNIAASGQYKASQSITAAGLVSSGLTVTLTAPSITLGNTFIITATSGSSFVVTAANLPDVSSNPSLANYYSDNNTDEPYQATATYPFAQNNYDQLNPGNVINVVGGNKINGDWRTGYSYTVQAAQEMYYVYGSDYYDGTIASSKEEVITKFYKSVSIDANGIENVAFTDGEGKLLASARSGGLTFYPVVSLIGTQGFVDVHIPAGIPNDQIKLIGNTSSYNLYDLKTGAITSTLTAGNAYRIQALTPPTADPKTYISAGAPTYDSGALGITYAVNYYDYAVNVYNKTGQLIKSIQPNGYVSNSTVVASPAHMTSNNFASTYTYNSLGQLIETSSPDEGTSKFAYRKDGQIRYSQSALQTINTKVSYTDYDTFGRPIESGVIAGSAGIWASAIINPDGALVGGPRSEQTFTVYDFPENNTTSVAIPTNLTLAGVLATAGISNTNYNQNNLSGNVAITYTKPAATISAITWYSYDLYGRAEWIVQYNEGIGAKTIHYEYDYKGNVKKVIFQKDKNNSELFAHEYTYNANDALIKVKTTTDITDPLKYVTHADYSYYKTGELKRINIGQGIQGLDYVYTLGGQLKSINHPSLEAAKDPGGDSNDVFGLTLDYYKDDYLRTGKNISSSPTIGTDYNGNIKAARWNNKYVANDGNSNQKAYLYNYNRNNWLTGATFGHTDAVNSIITPNAKLAEKGISYDANGNIQTLQRSNEVIPETIVDNLEYKYNPGKNQLNYVDDKGTSPANSTDIKDQNIDNYSYDAIGQMTRNNQENLYYNYNMQGLVTEVGKGISGSPLVRFYYNERGQRIKKESFHTTAFTLQSTTYYSLDLSGNTMASYYLPISSSIIVQTELPIFGLRRLGIYSRSTANSNYEITDHLGNVRAVIPTLQQAIPSYADYYPFGELLPSRNSLSYRYAFQGQELDKETGMEAFQLRLWDGRLGRWLSPDPYGQHASPYLGMGNNPVSQIDSNGGYDTWFSAFGSWILGGFKGSIIRNPSDDNTDINLTFGIKYKDGSIGNYVDGSNLREINLPSIRYQDTKELGTPVFLISSLGGGGITLPTFNGGAVIFAGSYQKKLLQHERGHVEQIRELGAFSYLKDIGIPSLYNTQENDLEQYLFGKITWSIPHEEFYTETDANNKAFWLYGGSFYHRERTETVKPYNPLIGRVSKYDAIERLQIYYDLKIHNYIDIPTKSKK